MRGFKCGPRCATVGPTVTTDSKQWWKVRYGVIYRDGGYLPDQTLFVCAPDTEAAEGEVRRFQIEHTDGCPVRTFTFESTTPVPASDVEWGLAAED